MDILELDDDDEEEALGGGVEGRTLFEVLVMEVDA